MSIVCDGNTSNIFTSKTNFIHVNVMTQQRYNLLIMIDR